MLKNRLFTLIVVLLFFTYSVESQTFKAGVIGGLNVSQMDGDNHTGWEKLGVQFGAKAIAKISDRFHINIELLYNQKGARIRTSPGLDRPDYTIGVNFMEVPLLIDLQFGKVSNDHFKHHFIGGVGYARLLGANFKESPNSIISFKPFENDFEKGEISPILGYSYYFTENIAVDFRYSFAVSKLFIRDGIIPQNDLTKTKFLRNYYLTGRVSYIF